MRGWQRSFGSRAHSRGEDSVEFSCHGGAFIAQSVLGAVFEAGARQAFPGEFTRRAFLNGRIDLSQAEAVADLIASGSARAHRVAMEHLEGKLGRRVAELKGSLLDLCALLEMDLDFAEEGIELATDDEVREKLAAAEKSLGELAYSFRYGRIYRNGVSVALAGKPNSGKSSIFNALLSEERSIVTPVPGTTRDTIEECITVDGIVFRVTDTAGLRDVPDVVEAEGVRRARTTVRSSDIVVLVMDAAEDREPVGLHQAVRELEEGQKLIVALNKADLVQSPEKRSAVQNLVGDVDRSVFTSARTGEGIHDLREELRKTVLSGAPEHAPDLTITNERQYRAIARGLECIRLAMEAVEAARSNEFVAFDVRQGVGALAEITGEVTSDDVLNTIFGRFCIGK